MELIKDYDMKLHYHLGKVNVVADALSRKSYVNTLVSGGLPQELVENLKEFRLEIVPRGFVSATIQDIFRYSDKSADLSLTVV